MRPNNDRSVLSTGTAVEEIRFGLDQSAAAQAHIIGLLTDIYSDPIKAVVREYSTNALDAHIDAGNPAPIKVELPTSSKPVFTVYDNGPGLNVDDVKAVFSQYGNSTKRDSDEVNGTLGIGCKAALTYGLTFTVTAVKGGVKTLVLITKGEDGIPVGKVLDTVGTDEPNGVTVQVPVKQHDVETFCNKARAFYKFWNPGTVELVGDEALSFLRNDPELIWVDPDTAIHTKSQNTFIVQNNVAYPVRSQDCPTSSFGTITWVDSGAVNFTPSREALHYTARTNEVVVELRKYILANYERAIFDSLDIDGLSPFERLKLANRWRSLAPKTAAKLIGEFGAYPDLKGGSVWRFDFFAQRGAAYKLNPSWFDLSDERPIITNFPYKQVTTTVRKRLKKYFDGQVDYSKRYCFLFPEGVHLGVLEGHSQVTDWSVIAAATESVLVKEKAARAKQSKTFYTVQHKGQTKVVREDQLSPKDGPIVWALGVYHQGSRYPETQCVIIRSGQEDKLCRLYPTAISAQAYHVKQVEKVTKAITTYDELIVSSRNFFAVNLDDVTVARIADPDFKQVVHAGKQANTKTLADYQRVIGDLRNIRPHGLPEKVARRYPLAAHISSYARNTVLDDFVLYINAKFQSLTNQTTN
jgi:hypothetical protein